MSIPAEDWAATPLSVRLAVLELRDLVRDLTHQVRDLQARVAQNSHNSSSPPSSDRPSTPPKPPKVPRGRKRGAQKGHAAQQRPLLPTDQVQHLVSLYPSCCPRCIGPLPQNLPLAAPVRRSQVWDLPPIVPEVTEYQQQTVCCPQCSLPVQAPLPADAPAGAFGPRLTALVALLHGRYRLSLRESAALVAALSGIHVSTGSSANCCQRVSRALETVDTSIHEYVQRQATLNVDETSWSEGAQSQWLWTAVSANATCFRLQKSRAQASAVALLGHDFGGGATTDRAGAYNWLGLRHRQLCWAHLARNLQALVDYQHQESGWARALLVQVHELFAAWKGYQVGLYDQVALQQALLPVRLEIQEQLWQGRHNRWDKVQHLSRELLKRWEALWTFRAVEGVEPTNNAAERAIRPAVLWRKGCFGTQSAWGSRFAERLLSVAATCQKQGRDLRTFLTQTLAAHWSKQPLPLLV